MNKNYLVAFFLSFIPGASFFYLNRFFLAFVYGLPFTILFVTGAYVILVGYSSDAFLFLFLAACIWIFQFFHSVISLIRAQSTEPRDGEMGQKKEESERLFITFMSLIPGLGHMQLGLMNRGLTLMVGFFGLLTMVVFVTFFTSQPVFIVFLGLLPIVWIFNLFDVIQHLNKKKQGIELEDKSILAEIEANRVGKKSKAIALIFAIFPGAGHLYLGLQRRGFQFMAMFLIGIFLMDFLRLTMFLFLIPIVWFYSFFDALQKASQYDEELKDVPIFNSFVNHQKWVGIGLILFGGYYLFDRVLINALTPVFEQFFHMDFRLWYYNYFQTTVVCILLIGGGIRLLSGSKKKGEKQS